MILIVGLIDLVVMEVSFKKGFFYVFIANLINLVISLFTGFVLPKFLSITSYSTIKLFQLYIGYIGILHLGYSDSIYLKYGGKTADNIDKKEVCNEFFTFKRFQFLVTIICIVVSVILKNKILLFCSLVILPINISNYIKNFYQAIGEFKQYSRFTNIITILTFIVNLFLLLIIKSDNANIYIIGYIVVYILYCIYVYLSYRSIFNQKNTNFKYNYIFDHIKNGFFLMLSSFCGVIFSSIDRVFINFWFGAIKFAFYSFATSVESLINIFITPIITIMYNYLFNNLTKEKITDIKLKLLFFSGLLISSSFVVEFFVYYWIDKYIPAMNILYILFMGQFFMIIVRAIHINLYKVQKRQNHYFSIMILIIFISIVLNVIMYYLFKTVEAIAIATMITSIIWFIVGECDLKEYKLKNKHYIYVFMIFILYICINLLFDGLIAFFVYILVYFIVSLVFIKDIFIYIKKEFINIVNKYLLKK